MRQTHPSNGATTITVYDAFGRMAAEYSNQAPTGPSGLVYRMADHLGSTRLAMQGSSVLARYDYLPFGERIGSGINGRSSLYGSTGSMVITGQDQVVEQQFTAKERDAESGLDYFGAGFGPARLAVGRCNGGRASSRRHGDVGWTARGC